MITYKLVRVETNKPEKSVELTDADLDIIYDALSEHEVSVDNEEVLDAIYNVGAKLYSLNKE
jgi:formylmethanofuran dehydrogenase subunit E-like metal-binding protein